MDQIAKQKIRLQWIDIVKFWGIFAIVWGHTLSDGVVQHYLYSFHVPVFFFVIGLYFTAPKQSFWQFTGKKAYALLIPYLLFAIISILIFAVLGSVAASTLEADISGNSLGADVFDMLTGRCRANRPLWFLPSLFFFYVLCFWLMRFVEKKSAKHHKSLMLLVIVAAVALCLLNTNIFKVRLYWKIDAAVFMLAFFALAVLARPFFMKDMKSWVCALLATAFLLLGGITALCNVKIGYPENRYGNVLLFYLSAACTVTGLCMLSKLICRCKTTVISKAFSYVGQNTLPILLMHKFPILFFQVVFPWTRQPMKENDPFVGLLVSVVSPLACLLVDRFLRRFLPVFVGRRRTVPNKAA